MFSILKSDLVTALEALQKVVPKKAPSNKVLTNVLFHFSNNCLELAGSDADTTVIFKTPYSGFPEDILMPFGPLASFVTELPEKPIEFTPSGSNVKVQCARFQATFTTVDVKNYLNVFDSGVVLRKVDLKRDDLESGLRSTTYAMASNTGKPSLSTILFDFKNGVLNLISTDTFRVALNLGLPANTAESFQVTPQSFGIIILQDMLKHFGERIEVWFLSNRVVFLCDKLRCELSLIENKFPDYSKLIGGINFQVQASRSDVFPVVRSLSAFSDSMISNITFVFKPNLLHASAESELAGGGADSDIVYSGPERVTVMRSQYVADVLSLISEEKFEIGFRDNFSGLYFRGLNSQQMHLIMPVANKDAN